MAYIYRTRIYYLIYHIYIKTSSRSSSKHLFSNGDLEVVAFANSRYVNKLKAEGSAVSWFCYCAKEAEVGNQKTAMVELISEF